MITNTNNSSISFKRMYPEDYAEITGKTPHHSFYPKDKDGRIITDYFDDCIKRCNVSKESANLNSHVEAPKVVRYSELSTLRSLNKLVDKQKADLAAKEALAKPSLIKRIKNLFRQISSLLKI